MFDAQWRSQRHNNDKLVALCHALLPDDPTLAEEVSLAIEQPDTYYARFGERLEEGRRITESTPMLPWIALLDGLMERGHLVELDWRMEASSVMHSLDQVLPGQMRMADRWAWVDVAAWDNHATTEDFLKAIGARLLARGFVLACFALGTDSYPLTIIAQERFARIKALAEDADYGGVVPCLPGTAL